MPVKFFRLNSMNILKKFGYFRRKNFIDKYIFFIEIMNVCKQEKIVNNIKSFFIQRKLSPLQSFYCISRKEIQIIILMAQQVELII